MTTDDPYMSPKTTLSARFNQATKVLGALRRDGCSLRSMVLHPNRAPMLVLYSEGTELLSGDVRRLAYDARGVWMTMETEVDGVVIRWYRLVNKAHKPGRERLV
ncbi:MAG: hypothetical protein RQ757_07110 [Pseudomonadales bacterium]|nr:hypothetical protein [Pseudomonadales bacterium]